MPHVDISMYPGRGRETKMALAKKVQDLVAEELKIDKKVVSVSIKDVDPELWGENMEKFEEENLFVAPGE